MAKLTKRFVDAVKAPERGEIALWDSELPGFGLRVRQSGRRTWMVRYRARGRSRAMNLGTASAVTPHEARQRAREILAAVARGEDPAEARDESRKVPTVADLAARYLAEHAEVHKKPRSAAEDRRILDKTILPRLGKLRLDAVGPRDVQGLHHSLRKTPYAANRCLALLSCMFRLAEGWALRPPASNPCRNVRRYKERARERFLSESELAKLGETLTRAEAAGENPSAIAALRLLLLTGARRDEIRCLRWSEVDLDASALRLRDSKTGAKTIPLGLPARALIEAQPRRSVWVFSNREADGPVSLASVWAKIRENAEMPELRIHDLRHSFASVGAGMGQPLLVLGKILGHSRIATTQRYAHLSEDPQQAASDAIAAKIAAALEAEPDSNVVPLVSGQ